MSGVLDEAAWGEIGGRVGANLARAKLLCGHADTAQNVRLGDVTDLRSDILRSVVILLHATVEDLLRGLAEAILPEGDAKELKEVPLLGSTKPRQTTFTLEDLAAHRGLEVSDLIAKSVVAHFERSNYNHPGDIKALLHSVGVPATLCDPYARELAAMMSRRHLIAHRADRRIGLGFALHPIEGPTVETWIGTVGLFTNAVLAHARPVIADPSESDP